MANTFWTRFRSALGGDHRDPRTALRAAGFADEAAAASWARTLTAALPSKGHKTIHEVRMIRKARPDLTLRTAVYIADVMHARG